jgi:hypothetical protein
MFAQHRQLLLQPPRKRRHLKLRMHRIPRPRMSELKPGHLFRSNRMPRHRQGNPRRRKLAQIRRSALHAARSVVPHDAALSGYAETKTDRQNSSWIFP